MFICFPGSESYQSFWNIHPIRTQILRTSWPAVNQWRVYWTKSNRNCWPAKDAGKKDWNAFKSCININQFQVFLYNLPVDWILLNLFLFFFLHLILFFYLSPAERPNEGEKQTVHTQIPMDVPPVDLFNTGPPIIEDEVCKTQPYNEMWWSLFVSRHFLW